MKSQPLKNSLLFALTLGLLLTLGCSSDSPTEPTVGNNPSVPVSGGSSSTWTITVTATPDVVEQGGEISTVGILVTARRTSDNAPPPQNATAVLTTTAGVLSSSLGSGSSVGVKFDFNRVAEATLNLAGAPLGDVFVKAQLEGSFGQETVQVAEAAEVQPMSVFFVDPGAGSPTGGIANVHGHGFHQPVEVLFGTQRATVLSMTSTRIRVSTPPVTLPAGATRSVGVTVFSNIGSSEQETDTLSNGYVYARNADIVGPTIVSLTPTFGPNEGGTRVSIFGDGFGSEVQVFFGTSSLIEAVVREVTPTRVLVDTPAATGPNSGNQNSIVPVRIVNLGSGTSNTLPNAFQYGSPAGLAITSAGPTEGLYLGGTIVTTFGTGFDDPVALQFGGVGQSVISVTGTEIVARSVPISLTSCSEQSGPFEVTNIETGESTSSGISFTYRPIRPVISSLEPNQQIIDVASRERVAGEPDSITILGSGFDSPASVLFGDVNASGVQITAVDIDGIGTTVTADIPRFTGDFDVAECGVDGTQRVPTAVDVTIVVGPGECEDVFSRGFTYVPNDTSCNDAPPVSNPPTADFIFIDRGARQFDFINTSTGHTSSSWDFGDAMGTSNVDSPTYTYTADGDYTVTLTVTNADGSSSKQSVVTVAP